MPIQTAYLVVLVFSFWLIFNYCCLWLTFACIIIKPSVLIVSSYFIPILESKSIFFNTLVDKLNKKLCKFSTKAAGADVEGVGESWGMAVSVRTST